MSRYIDADAFVKEVVKIQDFRRLSTATIGEALNRTPTADVIPIEWIKEQKDKCFPDSITAIALNHLLTEWERREDGEIH